MQRSQNSDCAALECVMADYNPSFACGRRTSRAQKSCPNPSISGILLSKSNACVRGKVSVNWN